MVLDDDDDVWEVLVYKSPVSIPVMPGCRGPPS